MPQPSVLPGPPSQAPDTTDLAALVRAAQADPRAYGPLYRQFVRPVYVYCLARVGDRDAAEDITAEAFADALAALPRYRERGAFAAWLFRIVRRRIADHCRERARVGSAVGDGADDPFVDLDDRLSRTPLRRRLRAGLARLDAQQLELIHLRFAAGLTFPEIGALLGRPPDTVKRTLYRLLERLARDMEVHDDDAL